MVYKIIQEIANALIPLLMHMLQENSALTNVMEPLYKIRKTVTVHTKV